MTIRVGLAGTGWFAKEHAKLLAGMDGVEVTAVCGTSAAKAEAFASGFGGAKGYGSFTDMLDGGKLDAVYLCVPPFAHGDFEEQLIERGIPFLVEKPLGVDRDVPGRIAERLKERPVITSVGYHLRYRDSVNRLKDALDGTVVGMISGGWMGSFVNNSWWPKQELSGGQFIEQTTHLVDLMRYAAGEAEEVYAVFANRSVHLQYEHATVHDVGTVTIKLKSGAIATVSNTCVLPRGVFKSGLAFYTDKGIMDWDMQEFRQSLADSQVTSFKDERNPYMSENEAFIHAIRTGDTSRILSDYADAIRTHDITVAAYESAVSGKPVRIG